MLHFDSLMASWQEVGIASHHSNLNTAQEVRQFVDTKLEDESVIFAKAISALHGEAELLQELGFDLVESPTVCEAVDIPLKSPHADPRSVVSKRVIYQSHTQPTTLLRVDYFNQSPKTTDGLTNPTYIGDRSMFDTASIIMLSSTLLKQYQNLLYK